LASSDEEPILPKHYPHDFRREVSERLLAGEAVKDLADELDVSEHTLYRWRHAARADAGLTPGGTSYEPDPLVAARRRIKELEAELELVRKASELFQEGAVDPKGSSRLSED
jgi:transposase-like protein